ncbi:MAG: hypothetical protein IAF58_18940 [Leptolyngbya sp.]|nr:hypothetical protein [Candidatus Melainabacteria bacterium]
MPYDLKNPSQLNLSNQSVHCLEGKAFWQWWQLSDSLKLRPKRLPDHLKNDALRSISLFLLLTPVQVAFYTYCVIPHPISASQLDSLTRLLILVALVWLANVWLFASSLKNHQRFVQEVAVTADTLEIKAPFFQRKFHWFEIEQIFPFTDAESGTEMHQVTCTRGECFLLSPLLTDSEQLVSLIKSKVAHPPENSGEQNYRLSDSFLDAANVAIAAIFMAVSFVLLQNSTIPSSGEIIGFTVLFAALLAVHWFYKEKIPQLVRIKKSEVYLQTRSKKYVIPIGQILENKKFGKSLIFKTRTNWFMVAFLQKEQREKLLETSKLEVALR